MSHVNRFVVSDRWCGCAQALRRRGLRTYRKVSARTTSCASSRARRIGVSEVGLETQLQAQILRHFGPAQVLLSLKPSKWRPSFFRAFWGVSLYRSRHTVIACGTGAPDRRGPETERLQRDDRTSSAKGDWDVTRITIAAVMMMWMAATAARLDGQDLRISPTDAAVRVSVEILSRHVLQFAGLRVQVADAVVEHVVSPRAFVLISQREFVGMGLSRERVGVIVASGTASVLPKMPVVVAGAAGTFVGAQVTGVLTRSAALA